MKSALKKLAKSPLTYVLAQIKINPILEMEDYIPKLQETFRINGFPGFKPLTIQTIIQETNQNAQPTPIIKSQTQWHFTDMENTTGILIGSDFIVIHTSNYESFENIIKIIENTLQQCNNTELKIAFYERIGLRYINVITSSVEKYITKPLLGFQIKHQAEFYDKYLTNTETVQETKNGLVKIRATRISHINKIEKNPKIFLPPDLFPYASLLSFEQQQHKQKINQATECVILDLDHFIENRGEFEVKHIIRQIEQLHEGIEVAFREAVTEEALKAWQ
jgi:uncharacterized protein (TIGR04255 family)